MARTLVKEINIDTIESNIGILDTDITNLEQRLISYAYEVTTLSIASVNNGYVDRQLNNIQDVGNLGISLVGGDVSIPAGKYILEAESAFYRTEHNKLIIYNVTDDLVLNPDAQLFYAATGSNNSIMHATAHAYIDIPSAKTIRVTHYTQAAWVNGLSGGSNTLTGIPQINDGSMVAKLKITKVG